MFSLTTRISGRHNFRYMAKLCEQAERYEEMVTKMGDVAKLDVELTVEERNLLSVAYKNVIGARRASWRIISSIEQKEENKGKAKQVEMIKEYRGQVEEELQKTCGDILQILTENLIPSSTSGESKVRIRSSQPRPLSMLMCGCCSHVGRPLSRFSTTR